MKLIDALRIVSEDRAGQEPFNVGLACGFTPLHLQTYLVAHLKLASPQIRVHVDTGLFDDLTGNIARLSGDEGDAVAVVVEWADLDPRLGIRRLGGWAPADLADIQQAVEVSAVRLEEALTSAAEAKPIALCLPTLPLPAMFSQRPGESGSIELHIRESVASLAVRVGQSDRIRVCSTQRLDELSPLSTRRDVKAELSSGFPFSLDHASAVAAVLAELLQPPPPKKGLITDLDGTLWAGIVGEVGPKRVSWALDDHNHRHALYQQLLASLAGAGVLIAVASKNDPSSVREALQRPDLRLSMDSVFPVEANWGPKSESIQRILEAWNIAPDAVVFVDDSPIEIAEVQATFPEITGLQFPGGDEGDVWTFMVAVRSLFGKSDLTNDDGIRMGSLRARREFDASMASSVTPDEFLASTGGCLTVAVDSEEKARALELVNKTNQFNLNGVRLSDAAFERKLAAGASLITVDYEDRYGPLGTIAAILAQPLDDAVVVDAWVMSCRAFSRRIEHHCMQFLFDRFAADSISLAYQATDRNGPLREFLSSCVGAPAPGGVVSVNRDDFALRTPLLVHRVVDGRLEAAEMS